MRAPLPPQVRLVRGQRPGGQHTDAPVADLPAVAVRAVQHVTPPPRGHPGQVGQLVGEPGRHEQPPGPHAAPAGQRHQKAVALPRRGLDPPGDDLAAVPGHLIAPGRRQLGGRRAFPGQAVVHVPGQGVARIPGVDHQHRPPRPRQRQAPAEPGGAAAHHHHVVRLVHGALPPARRQRPRCRVAAHPTTSVAGMANDDAAARASVAPRLRALRQRRGTTLTQLAEIIGIPVSTLSRLQSGGRKPTLELLLPSPGPPGVPRRAGRRPRAHRRRQRRWRVETSAADG